MSGWVGRFVSYAPSGAAEEDVRFQDIWLRAFQERGEDGRFHMKMVRKADQQAKSWPRAGVIASATHQRSLQALDDVSQNSNALATLLLSAVQTIARLESA